MLKKLLTVILAVTFAANAFAKKGDLHYLQPGQPDIAAAVAPPPQLGSAEQKADLETVRVTYHAAEKAPIDKAESKIEVFHFIANAGLSLNETNLPKTAAFFHNVMDDAKTVVGAGKDFFKRPRPFVTDPSLGTGNSDDSFSYPSGHSTESMTLALVLADLLPKQRETILGHGRWIGWHRVELGRHYPTDIFAGRFLAQAIVEELKKNPAFQKDFAEVKQEIETSLAQNPLK